MDDSVKVKCTRCSSTFRDRAGRLRDGYSRECPNCNVLLFFDSESPDPNIRKALTEARRVRNLLSG
jgi:predicted  nucleic acid-binding Zn-ribbon protein